MVRIGGAAIAAACLGGFGDQAVEWLCDYGQSVPRVLGSLCLLYVLFTLLYGLTGSVLYVTPGASGAVSVTTRSPVAPAAFSLLAMTTQSAPELVPAGEGVHFPTGLETLFAVFLTGLLGFVAGNRIRR